MGLRNLIRNTDTLHCIYYGKWMMAMTNEIKLSVRLRDELSCLVSYYKLFIRL